MKARVYLDHSFGIDIVEALEAYGIDVQRPPERIDPNVTQENKDDFFLYDQFNDAQDQGRVFITRDIGKMQFIEALNHADDVNPTHNGIVGIETVTGLQMSPEEYAHQLDYIFENYESDNTVLYLDKDGTQRLDLASGAKRFAPIERHIPEPISYQSLSPYNEDLSYKESKEYEENEYDPYHEEQEMALETYQHTPEEMQLEAESTAYEVTSDSGYELAD